MKGPKTKCIQGNSKLFQMYVHTVPEIWYHHSIVDIGWKEMQLKCFLKLIGVNLEL